MFMEFPLVLFLLFYVGNVVVDTDANSTNFQENATSRVVYQYSSDVVPCEFIVTFRGYYARSSRENYLNAALKNAGVSLL